MNNQETPLIVNNPYKIKTHDRQVKPLILKWLAKQFGYENYPHSYTDQWITWDVYNGMLTVSFDLRQDEHNKLLSLIPKQFLGIPQSRTLKIVNENSFYIRLEHLLNIEYPDIVGNELIEKHRHQSTEKGGWYIKGEYFHTYDWVVYLSDGTTIRYTNRSDVMDLMKKDYIYKSIIEERAFLRFLEKLS